MRIKRISVKNLFGTFDHEIPLNMDERVTIMIGPNGYGKTMILKMVDEFFKGKYGLFFKIPFTEFTIYLEDGSNVKLEKTPSKKEKRILPFSLFLVYTAVNAEPETIPLTDTESLFKSRDYFMIFRELLDEDLIDRETYYRIRRGADIDDLNSYPIIAEKYWELLSNELITNKKLPAELAKNLLSDSGEKFIKFKDIIQKKGVNIYLIQTHRLVTVRKVSGEKKTDAEMPVVKVYSDELASRIGDALKISAEKAQYLDGSFPKRVITQIPLEGTREKFKILLKQLQELREKRVHLKETGILVDLGDDPKIPESIEDESRLKFLNGVLAEYVKDTQEKLAVFDDLANKIDLLKRVINIRFAPHKKMIISKEKGFVFLTSTGNELAPEDLSSGEQHELVLLYELLFRVPQGSLVLIDEPELSLHIAWQQKFLEDLLDITNIAKLDVLIATHSPDIIHDHWRLTVDLGGK